LGNNCLGWCQGSEQIIKAVIEVLCRLPDNAAEALLCNSDVVVIDGSTTCAWSWQHACPPHDKVLVRRLYVIVLRDALREMPYKSVVAEVADAIRYLEEEHARGKVVITVEDSN